MAALVPVAPGDVARDAPAPVLMGGIVGAGNGELLERPEVRLDGVQPAGIGRRVDGLDVVSGHKPLQAGMLVRVEVIHDDVEAGGRRIARAQPGEDGEEVLDRLAFAHLADEAVGVNVVEGEELLGSLEAAVGCPKPPGMTFLGPALAVQRPQFERATLVEADDCPVLGRRLVEVEDAVFFTSNSGSFDSFQVFVCW